MFSPSEQSACDMTYTQHSCYGGKTCSTVKSEKIGEWFHQSYSSKQTPSFLESLGASSVNIKHPAQMQKTHQDVLKHLTDVHKRIFTT